jgi:vancomycin resistance protein YoaR
MSQHPPASDETVRFRGDAPGGRPPLDGVRHASVSARASAGAGRQPVGPPSATRVAADSAPGPVDDAASAGDTTPVEGAPVEGDTAPVEGDTARVEGAPVPAPVETVTPAEPVRPAEEFEGEADDTRPVTRDWRMGAPDAGATGRSTTAVASAASGAPAGPEADDAAPAAEAPSPAADRPADVAPHEDDFSTQKFDLTEAEPVPVPADRSADHQDVAEPDTGVRSRTGGSDSLPPIGDEPPPGSAGPWWRRKAVLVPAGAIAVLAAAYGIDLAVAQGSIPRSTVVAGVDIGGLSPAAAATTLERELAPVVSADHTVVADDVEAALSPAAAGLTLDVDGTVDAADHQPFNPWTRLITLFDEREVTPVIAREETALSAQLETVAAQVDRAPVDATITFEGTTPSVADAADGRALDRDGAVEAIVDALADGRDPETPIELPVEITPVRVDRAAAERVLEETVRPAVSAPVAVVSQDGGTTAEVPVAAIAASLTFTPEEDGELTVAVDPVALQTALGEELAAFGTAAEDADFEISGGAVTVVPSVDGTGVDPAKLAEQLVPVLASPAPRSVTAELGPVPADFTTEEAQALGITEEIGSFTTRFTSAASGTNIRVVAAEVDGALVMPGETFSLNTFTGPRGTAQGYVEAAVIQNGELSKAVGGGISQFATTMFNAVFFAGLEDVHHKPHSFYISRYPAGREATVYEGAIDLQWRNDSDTGVYIDTNWVPGAITVTFYGTKRYEIEAIEGARRNPRQPAYQEKVDDGDCTAQPGIPGFDITVTRVFRDLQTGAELRRENFNTSYAAEAIIKCIPPAEPAPAPAPTTPGG